MPHWPRSLVDPFLRLLNELLYVKFYQHRKQGIWGDTWSTQMPCSFRPLNLSTGYRHSTFMDTTNFELQELPHHFHSLVRSHRPTSALAYCPAHFPDEFLEEGYRNMKKQFRGTGKLGGHSAGCLRRPCWYFCGTALSQMIRKPIPPELIA